MHRSTPARPRSLALQTSGWFGGLALLALAIPAAGQSINIDLGDGAGVPDPAYSAAGQAGVWNAVTIAPNAPPTPGGVVGGGAAESLSRSGKAAQTGVNGQRIVSDPGSDALLDINGQPTNIVFTSPGGPAIFTEDDPATEDNDGRLFDDLIPGNGDVVTIYELEGVAPGEYDLYIYYAWYPGAPTMSSLIMVSSDTSISHATTTASTWPGDLVEGITHTAHTITTTDGRIRIETVGGIWGTSSAFNGLQLVRRTSASDDPPPQGDTDLNGDGITNELDLILFMELWLDLSPGHGCDGFGPGATCGDIDLDGDLTRADFFLIAAAIEPMAETVVGD